MVFITCALLIALVVIVPIIRPANYTLEQAPAEIRITAAIEWMEGDVPASIPVGAVSTCIHQGNGIESSRPTRVRFDRDMYNALGVRGLPIGAVPIFDLIKLAGKYEVTRWCFVRVYA